MHAHSSPYLLLSPSRRLFVPRQALRKRHRLGFPVVSWYNTAARHTQHSDGQSDNTTKSNERLKRRTNERTNIVLSSFDHSSSSLSSSSSLLSSSFVRSFVRSCVVLHFTVTHSHSHRHRHSSDGLTPTPTPTPTPNATQRRTNERTRHNYCTFYVHLFVHRLIYLTNSERSSNGECAYIKCTDRRTYAERDCVCHFPRTTTAVLRRCTVIPYRCGILITKSLLRHCNQSCTTQCTLVHKRTQRIPYIKCTILVYSFCTL